MKTTRFPPLTRVKTLEARLGEARFGTPMPHIVLETERAAGHRHLQALAHLLAARLELETPPGEGWCVAIDVRSDERALVRLELVNGDDAEAKRGLELAQSVVAASR